MTELEQLAERIEEIQQRRRRLPVGSDREIELFWESHDLLNQWYDLFQGKAKH